jgi:hypothetical protein
VRKQGVSIVQTRSRGNNLEDLLGRKDVGNGSGPALATEDVIWGDFMSLIFGMRVMG